jgi:hypothetical protein
VGPFLPIPQFIIEYAPSLSDLSLPHLAVIILLHRSLRQTDYENKGKTGLNNEWGLKPFGISPDETA